MNKYPYKLLFALLTVFVASWSLVTAVPPVTRKPNILFCIADDASMEHMRAYGFTNWVHTPSFDQIAADGALFMNAYTPNAKCSPSRACILTGRNPWQLEAAANHVPYFPEKFGTWMESLKNSGYTTGFTGKGWAPGKALDANGKPRELTGKAWNAAKLTPPTSGISAIDYAANFESFLASRKDDQPFSFWFGAIEPHRVYEYGSGVSKGKKNLADIDRVPEFWPDNDTVRNDMLDYAYEVEYFDHQLGRMLKVLEKHGELNNTLIIVTSDNGMPFPRVKGHLYAYDNHLPLAMMWKDGFKSKGLKIDDMVSFIDLAPTILEATGTRAEQFGLQPIQGRSLLPLIKAGRSGEIDKTRDHVLLGRERTDVGRPDDQGYPARAIVTKDYIFSINYTPDRWPAGNPETGYLDSDGSPTKTQILNFNRAGKQPELWNLSFGKRSSEELYDLSKDRDALHNLAYHPAFAKIKATLRGQLERELKQQKDPRMVGHGDVFDKYPYAEDATRDFYNRQKKGEKVKAGWVNESDFETND